MISTRTFERSAQVEQTVPAERAVRVSLGNALRNAAAFARFALCWCGAYLGIAAILLLGWAFSS